MQQQLEERRAGIVDRFAGYVLRGRREAIITALIASFMPLFTWLALVVLSLVTLRKGAKEGFLILLWLVLPSVVIGLGYKAGFAVIETVVVGLFAWLLAIMLRITASWTRVLELTTVSGLIAVMMVDVYLGDPYQYWLAFSQDRFLQVNSLFAAPADTAALMPLIIILAKYMTGVVVCTNLLTCLVNLSLARWLQARLYNPGGLGKELQQVRLNWIANGVLALIILSVFMKITMAYNLLPVIIFPYFLAGMSLIHFLVNLTKYTWIWLFSLYAVLILFFVQAVGLLMILALADIGMDIRKRAVAS